MAESDLGLGLYFFSALEEGGRDVDAYQLMTDAAQVADERGLDFVWVPERHFTPFGGSHPNPSVVAAALAMVTRSVRIRAGSVVLPLHDPVRVAEEWAVVDNLSRGRVEISSATGWNSRDFVLAPDAFADRAAVAGRHLRTVRELWSGAEITRTGPDGERLSIRTYPRPVQPHLPVWVTATGNPATFAYAGEIGAGLLTGYGFLPDRQLSEQIEQYRQAHQHHQGGRGRVSIMVHAAIGEPGDEMRQAAAGPLRRYLAAFLSQGTGQDGDRETDKRLDFAVQRYLRGRSLIGDRDDARATMRRLDDVGVDEIACLIDFGLPRKTVLDTVAELAALHTNPS